MMEGMRRRLLSRRALAWSLAVLQIGILVNVVAYYAWEQFWFPAELAVAACVAFALVGALISSQRTRFAYGWFMLLAPLPGTIAFACSEYVDLARVQQLPLPFPLVIAWVGNWIWTPSAGLPPAFLTVRFPDGRVPRRWRFVEWIAVAGTVILGGSIAWPSMGGSNQAGAPAIATASYLGLVVIAVSALCGLASLVWRYRRGNHELRAQMKWILFATMIVTAAIVYAAVVEVATQVRFDFAIAPFYVALAALPIAVGIAILRHRLFDIDVIISRTLVYAVVTGILGGLYIGVIELTQQLSILYTGQRSETAIVVTAFIVAGAFTPVQKWTDAVADRRFRRSDAAASMRELGSSAESVVRVIDPHRFAHVLLDQSVTAFEAEGGAIYLHDHGARPLHGRGSLSGGEAADIKVHHGEHELGRLVLGHRRGGMDYSHRDVEALRRCAAALGDALGVATELGHISPRPSVAHPGLSNGRQVEHSTAIEQVPGGLGS